MSEKYFLRAFRKPLQNHVPFWFMRQAGRYLPEYRKTKEEAGGFISLCTNEEHAAEVALQPLRRFNPDAAILFSDIITPFLNLNLGLEFAPGPFLQKPVQTHQELEILSGFSPSKHVSFVGSALNALKKKLDPSKALIGFCGAPFTLMAYTTVAKFSGISETKKFLYRDPEFAFEILSTYSNCMASYLKYQIENGAEAVQLFDTWAGELSTSEYRRFALPFIKKTIVSLKESFPEVPVIYFAGRSLHLLEELTEIPFDGFSADALTPINKAGEVLGKDCLIQGNLDPFLLFAERQELEPVVKKIIEAGLEHGKFIFNLGHGIHKDTNPEKVALVAQMIRNIN